VPDAHFVQTALAASGVKTAVSGDGPRETSEETLVVLDGRYQQQSIGSRLIDRNVSDDSAFSFLHLHDRSKLRWPIEFSFANDLRPGLEDADDLARRSRLGPEHAGAGLSHHLTAMFGRVSDRGGELFDAASTSTSHRAQL